MKRTSFPKKKEIISAHTYILFYLVIEDHQKRRYQGDGFIKYVLTLIFSLKSLQVIFLLWAIMYNFMKTGNLLTIMILTIVRLNGLMLTRNFGLNLVNQLKSSIWISLASIVSKKTQLRLQIVSTNIFRKSLVASYHGQQMQMKPLVMARTSFKNSKTCLCPFLNQKSRKN